MPREPARRTGRKFKELLAKLKWGTTALNVPFAATGNGIFLIGKADGKWYGHIGARREPMIDQGLSFVRRSFEGGWHYFVANQGKTNFDGWITLARTNRSVVILDPMTGGTGSGGAEIRTGRSACNWGRANR